MLTTSSCSSAALNPEAHEFKYRSLPEYPPRYDEESNQDYLDNGKKSKG